VHFVEGSEQFIEPLVRLLRLALEVLGALWIAIGSGSALLELLSAFRHHRTTSFTSIRLSFSRYLSLALEFQLASDILSTAVAPTWDDIGKLGATAAIRTALNFFLSREMKEYRERTRRPEET
jgi:uncharacterized membrane protein